MEHSLRCFQRLLEQLQSSSREGSDGLKKRKKQQEYWRDVHSFVVLHLGNIPPLPLPIHNRNDSKYNNDETTEQGVVQKGVLTLGSCLLQIYKRKLKALPSQEKSTLLFSKEELQVVFQLVVQQALTTATTTQENSMSPRSTQEQVQLISIWLDILQLLVRNIQNPTIRAMEDLTVLLVRLLCDTDGTSTSSLHHRAEALLNDLSQDEDCPTKVYFATQILTAVEALQRNAQHELASPPDFFTNQHDNLLHWKCLAQSQKGATSLSQSRTIIEELVTLAVASDRGHNQKNNNEATNSNVVPMRVVAVDCLSLIALNRHAPSAEATTADWAGPPMDSAGKKNSHVEQQDWVLKALLHVLVETSDPVGVCHRTIPGLTACVANTTVPNNSWEDVHFLERVFSRLLEVATHQEQYHDDSHNLSSLLLNSLAADQKRDAAALVIVILEQTAFLPTTSSRALFPFAKAMKFLGCLLSTIQEQDIVLSQLAMAALHREMCLSNESRRRVVLESPNILQQLGQLSCHIFTPRFLQNQVMQIFESVSRPCDTISGSHSQHANYNDIVGILARQSKVLESLVLMASSAPPPAANNNDDNLTAASNSQELAVMVLVRLASNVCNRRILAQQVGVLSCLIRYARRLSDLEQQQQQRRRQEQQRPNTPDNRSMGATLTMSWTGGDRVCLKDLKQRITELAEAM